MIEEQKSKYVNKLNELADKLQRDFDKKLQEIYGAICQRINEIYEDLESMGDKNNKINNIGILSDLEEIEIDVKLIDDEEKQCAICLENYSIGNKIIYLPCCHYFHSSCIRNWLKIKNICPYCKREV